MFKNLIFVLLLTLVACHSNSRSKDVPSTRKLVDTQLIDNSFRKELTMNDVHFSLKIEHVSNEKVLSVSTLGLEIREYDEKFDITGEIFVDAELTDLNGDDSPELLIFTQSVGSGSYGKLYAFSVNNMKSMSQVYFKPIYEEEELKQGYMGHDVFKVINNALVLRFPIYNAEDTNAKPTGGIREISYRLVDGADSRRFEMLEVTDHS